MVFIVTQSAVALVQAVSALLERKEEMLTQKIIVQIAFKCFEIVT
jgi:hypothetical protein